MTGPTQSLLLLHPFLPLLFAPFLVENYLAALPMLVYPNYNHLQVGHNLLKINSINK